MAGEVAPGQAWGASGGVVVETAEIPAIHRTPPTIGIVDCRCGVARCRTNVQKKPRRTLRAVGDEVDANDQRRLEVGSLDLNGRRDQRRAGVDLGDEAEEQGQDSEQRTHGQ